MFKTNPEVAKILKTLTEYIDGQPDGEDLPWIRIEADTGVKMDNFGKTMLRRALRRRPYEAIRGVGVRLSCPQTALVIAQSKLVAVDNSVRRADKTQQELQARHLSQMATGDQQRMLLLASFFGAIRTVAKNATVRVFKPVNS